MEKELSFRARRAWGAVGIVSAAVGVAATATCHSQPRSAPEVAPTVSRAAPSAPTQVRAQRDVWRARSDAGRFDVEWSARPGIVFNEPFELDCTVRFASGEPADGVQVQASAWMPAHFHGMVRQPRTEPLGDGRYRVSGMLLHMDGHWQIFLNLGFDGLFERAAFDLVLAPDEAADALAGLNSEEVSRLLAMSPLPEAPSDPTNAHDLDERAAHLGQFLFFDPRLSGSGATSCATCHEPGRGWSDGKALAVGEGPLNRRTMPLWNVAHQRWFFWDGRADSLWSQALQPLEDPREMAGDRTAVARLVLTDPELRRAYTSVFGSPLELDFEQALPLHAKPVRDDLEHPSNKAWEALDERTRAAINTVCANVGKAIAAFERRIVSRDSPFDEFVEGLRQGDAELIDKLPSGARRGLQLFLGRANCHFCHSGPNFSDREFHNNRAPTRDDLPRDLGRFAGVMRLQNDPFNGVGAYSDQRDGEARSKLEHLPVSGHVWGEFRTPTLRSVALGGPFMHQGQFDSLERVVDFYSDEVPPPNLHADTEVVLVRLGLTQQEKSDLVEFLRSLTGAPLPEHLLRQPHSPVLD